MSANKINPSLRYTNANITDKNKNPYRKSTVAYVLAAQNKTNETATEKIANRI